MGPFSVFTLFVVLSHVLGAVDKTSFLVFQRMVKQAISSFIMLLYRAVGKFRM